MVWVSNRSAQDIKVTITNKTGGDSGIFEVTPEPLLIEGWKSNHWSRSGAESATVTFVKSGVKFETSVNALDLLTIYGDTYIITPSTKQQYIS